MLLLKMMIQSYKIMIQSYKNEEVLKILLKEGPRQMLETSKENKEGLPWSPVVKTPRASTAGGTGSVCPWWPGGGVGS